MSENVILQNVEAALRELGALNAQLTESEKQRLEDSGFIVLDGAADKESLQQLRLAFEQVMKKEGFLEGRELEKSGSESMGDLIAKQFTKDHELYHEQADPWIDNLVNKGEAFDQTYIHPKVLAAVYAVMGGELKLSSLEAMEVLPKRENKGAAINGTVTVIWMLDDFNEENGSIRIFPLNANGNADFVTGAAGSICIIKDGVRFEETTNQSKKNRRAIYCRFVRRDQEALLNQREFLRRSTYLRLTPAAKYILNV